MVPSPIDSPVAPAVSTEASPESPSAPDVVVVGAGLSGLACARLLHAAGVDVLVVDAADAVGGRVRTDDVEGFRLDRGFQVLLTAYEEVQSQVDLARLQPGSFTPGSLIWTGGQLETMGDPFRNPSSAMASLGARVGSLGDKMKVARLRHRLLSQPARAVFQGPDRSTQDELEELGFSDAFIDAFFRPFLGGVFLERDLETSARLFRYYFRCFAEGDAVLPAGGMQRLPEHLAEPLAGHMVLNARVGRVTPRRVELTDGRAIEAAQVVVAVDGHAAASLIGTPSPTFKTAITSYFAAEHAPVDEPVLVLDGEGTGPANHVAVVSHVASGLAPEGAHLISVSGVGAAADDAEAFRRAVPDQLRRWFGDSVRSWNHLRTYRIPHALPSHPAHSLPDPASRVRRPDGIIVAGDYTRFGAIQGALLSGRLAAEAVLASR